MMEEQTHMRQNIGVFVTALLGAFLFSLPLMASAANPVVSGTVYYPNSNGEAGTPASGVAMEIHNGNSTVFFSTTTDGSGNYSFTDDTGMDGELMGVEMTEPEGYNTPTNMPYSFTYDQATDSSREVDFVLVDAPKTVNITVQDIDGTDIEADVAAYPQGGGTQETTSGTGDMTLYLTGGSWFMSTDANLSETTNISDPDADDDPGDRPSYPWIAPRSMAFAEVAFAEDSSEETAEYTATVVPSDHYVTVKLLDADGEVLTGNSFSADVRMSCYNDDYGTYSTQRKVNNSGVAAMYLLPGTCRMSANHPQLDGQHFRLIDSSFVVPEGAGKTSLGTIQAVESTGVISGRVKTVRRRSGTQSSPNITVRATNIDRGSVHTAETTAGGSYEFTTLPDGEFSVTVDESGYLPEKSAVVNVSNTTEVTGIKLRAVQLDATVAGNVRLDGVNVEDASAVVQAVYDGYTYTSEIDEDGGYSIQLPTLESDDRTATLRVITQNGDDFFRKKAKTVRVRSNQTVRQNLGVNDNEGTVNGSLLGENGGALGEDAVGQYSTVTAIHNKTNSIETADVATDGSFSLDLGPGTWTVIPQLDPQSSGVYASQGSNTRVTVSAGETTSKNIRLRNASATITGTITDPDGGAVIGAPVTASNLAQLQAQSGAVDPDEVVTTTTLTDDSGAYTLGVPGGRYTMTVGGTPDTDEYIEPELDTVTVADGESATYDGQYDDAGATVSGRVNGSYKSVDVQFFSSDGGVETVDVVNGRYSANLNPGTWTMVASGMNKKGKVVLKQKRVSVSAGANTLNTKVTATDLQLPSTVVTSGSSDQTLVVSNANGARVIAPAYSLGLGGTVNLSIAAVPVITPTANTTQVGLSYEVTATEADGQEITELNSPVTVQVPVNGTLGTAKARESYVTYENSDLESQLSDGMAARVKRDGNNQASTVTMQTRHFTRFSVTTTGQLTKRNNAPRKVKVKVLSPTKVKVSWKKPKKKRNVVSPVVKYRVEVRKCKANAPRCTRARNFQSNESKWKVKNKVKKQRTRTRKKTVVKRLKADTYYQVRVAARNQAGRGVYSQWMRFKTPALD